MPLILCPDCKKQISDKADACPKCGRPVDKNVVSSETQEKLQSEKKAEVTDVIWGCAVAVVLLFSALVVFFPGLLPAELQGFFLVIAAIAFVVLVVVSKLNKRNEKR